MYSTTTETTIKNALINASNVEEEIDDEIEEHSPPNFLTIIGMVQDTLLRTKNRNIGNKLLFLKNLRDSLLINIGKLIAFKISECHITLSIYSEEKMRAVWQPPNKSEETREYKEEHYHMDFPSNEGALMTIGFLTFAVFLIKLVLV